MIKNTKGIRLAYEEEIYGLLCLLHNAQLSHQKEVEYTQDDFDFIDEADYVKEVVLIAGRGNGYKVKVSHLKEEIGRLIEEYIVYHISTLPHQLMKKENEADYRKIMEKVCEVINKSVGTLSSIMYGLKEYYEWADENTDLHGAYWDFSTTEQNFEPMDDFKDVEVEIDKECIVNGIKSEWKI